MARRLFTGILFLSALAFPLFAVWKGNAVERFATLPNEDDAPRFAKGIAADARGRIYVAAFDREKAMVHVFEAGKHRHTIALPAGVVPLGLEIDHLGRLYVANFAGGTVLRYSRPLQASGQPDREFSVCAGPAAGCGLNALTIDTKGDLHVSDSLGGNVFMIDLGAGTTTIFLSDELLRPREGFAPLGANGLAFDVGGKNLYIANTARDSVLRYDLGTHEVHVFASGIWGADGVMFDHKGTLWVAASQAHEVVALDPSGTIVERVGSFDGMDRNGAVKGLLFPASIAISRGHAYVTNLALQTVSRFRLRAGES